MTTDSFTRLRHWLWILILVSCSKNSSETRQEVFFIARMDAMGEGRLHYSITGPEWETPNVQVGDTVFSATNGLSREGFLVGEASHMLAYVSGSSPEFVFWPDSLKSPVPSGELTISGALRVHPGTGRNESFVPWFTHREELEILEDGYEAVQVFPGRLPGPAARWMELELTFDFDLADGSHHEVTSRHELALTWRKPLPKTPLYQRILRWGGKWLDRDLPEMGPEPDRTPEEKVAIELEVADRLLVAMAELADKGYRYGPLKRPSGDYDRAEVFLDFKQSACSEFRGFFMALLETQGMAPNWLAFMFLDPRSDWYSMYETIPMPALGRKTQVWRHANHVVVELHGRIYDPVYGLILGDEDVYEDTVFERFCFGEDTPCVKYPDWCHLPSGPQGICMVNPAGHDPQLGMTRHRGTAY